MVINVCGALLWPPTKRKKEMNCNIESLHNPDPVRLALRAFTRSPFGSYEINSTESADKRISRTLSKHCVSILG